MKYTPEPWHIFEENGKPDFHPGIDAENMTIVLWGDEDEFEGVRGETPEQAIANARRIVACVNACKNISTDRLEKMVPGTLANLLTLKGKK